MVGSGAVLYQESRSVGLSGYDALEALRIAPPLTARTQQGAQLADAAEADNNWNTVSPPSDLPNDWVEPPRRYGRPYWESIAAALRVAAALP